MATTQGSPLQDEDLQSWYNSLNTIISNYGGGEISQLTVPADNEKAKTSHVNNFFNKMDEMKQDEYLGSVSSIYPTYSIVQSGTLIQSNIGTILSNATNSNYLGQIKCRNKATYSNTANKNETCGSGSNSFTCGSGVCSSGACGSGFDFVGNFLHAKSNCSSSFCKTFGATVKGHHAQTSRTHGLYYPNTFCGSGTYSHGTNQHGTNQHGTNLHGTFQHGTNSHGTCSHVEVIDILCQNKTKLK